MTQIGDRVRLNITLMKSGECPMGERWIYGLLSGNFMDLEGQIVAPEAMEEAIPLFLAPRGPTANDIGGPLRWHHNDKFEGRTHELPVGVVTAMWVDEQGFTHFQAVLSKVTKEANDLWALLQEGKVKFGASVGGVILDMRSAWNQKEFRLIPTITKIRIDEISITDNPAFRTGHMLPNGSYGSYVLPLCGTPVLAKSAGSLHKSVIWQPEQHPRGEGGKFSSKGGKAEKPHEHRHTDLHNRIRSIMHKLEARERAELPKKMHNDRLKELKARMARERDHPAVDPRFGSSTMPDHVLAIRHSLQNLKHKVGGPPKPDPAYVNRPTPFPDPNTTPRREATAEDVRRQVDYEIDLATAKAKVRDAVGRRDAVDNEGNPSPPTSTLGNLVFPQGTSDQFGTKLMGDGVTGGYNVTNGGDYLLDNRPAVSYAFYEEGHHGEHRCPEADNLRHLEAVKLFLTKAGIPFKVEALQGAVHNDGSWESEDHMRITPGPGGKGHVEHTNQQVIVAYPRSQEELEDVAHTLKAVSPWHTPDIRVVGATRPVMGFDTAYANVQRATDGPGRFIVLSKSGTNTNFQGWKKAPIQVLSGFKEWLAD